MAESHVLKWEPITDLPKDWRDSLASPQTHTLVDVWKEQADELRKNQLFQDFLDRLRRQWAIETGVIEGLYHVSDAGTKTLIEKGLDASLLTHDDTDQPEADVVTKIKDQHQALMGMYQFVSGQRLLGTSYIKELHQVLTAHQLTYIARDTLGNEVTRDLPRGEWKRWPNNVEHLDGTVFEYCPPEHVASEMDRLIEMSLRHVADCVPADIEASWLHHRFTIIHPFTDGNGRVARCLATLVMLKENWLPFVVTRRDHENYIAALRQADEGNLRPLVDFIGLLQRQAIREAFRVSASVISEANAVSGILDAVKLKFRQQRLTRQKLVETSFAIADALQLFALQRLESVARDITEAIQVEGPNYRCWADGADCGSDRAHYFYHQTVQAAKKLGYFADRRRYQTWVRLAIITDHRTELLFSFHGIGPEQAGVLGCSALGYTRDQTEDGDNGFSEVVTLCVEPFEFVYSEDGLAVQRRFGNWLEDCLVAGLHYWQKTE